MKELIIEQKAKAYDKVREKIAARFGTNVVEEIFSEFEESEDERIKKSIMHFVKINGEAAIIDANISVKKALAWLEKQGEQKPISQEYADAFDEFMSHIPEKEPEFSESCYNYDDMVSAIQFGIKWQQQHNSIVKVEPKYEPKFKIGDWIYHDNGYRGPYLITNINEHGVELDNNIRIKIEDCYDYHHLWTIDDAKDGDVLFMDNGSANCIFIYKSSNNGIINKYASYNNFGFEGEHYLVLNDGYVIPATTEQRDLLFQKMKEAGYEWDAEKKELKKIEQKPAWSESDERHLNTTVAYLKDAREFKKTAEDCINWLKSLKQRIGE